MLEFTNVRNGAVLSAADGVETENTLTVKVEGITDSHGAVFVNGKKAGRSDRSFSCEVELSAKINSIEAETYGAYGTYSHKITVAWDKKSFKRYGFFIDDNIFFAADIARERPKSLFDHFYLKRLREIHLKYGTKFVLNMFYRNDHSPFELKDFPDTYREEWKANSDWLKMAFHAYSEFPDRPYQHVSGEKLAADFDLVKNEVIRFAGEESFIAPNVLHWAITDPANFHVLQKRGVNILTGGYLNAIVSVDESAVESDICDTGYFYEKEVSKYMVKKGIYFDPQYKMFLGYFPVCCNYNGKEEIAGIMDSTVSNPQWTQGIYLMTHEQYSYPEYENYIPDHMDRMEYACKLASEADYQPVFITDGIMGNKAWE